MGHKRRMLVAKGEAMNFREAYRTWWANAFVLSVLVASDPLLYFGEKDGRKVI